MHTLSRYQSINANEIICKNPKIFLVFNILLNPDLANCHAYSEAGFCVHPLLN